ncbi:MAG: lipid-A-disaccharide synthase [Candidatus Krumholzibacteriota bacterium]|nr:lipid-A-disaccharide synthase [Candidatus Krumholzibacteriota bacterium]
MKSILMTCGETSGDEHGSLLVRELKALDPDRRIVAMGGEKLRSSGAEVLFPMEKFAFMGFSEIITGLPGVLALEMMLKKLIRSGEIGLFIPVDYPGLNLRLARYARKKGVPVLYFISPQVWAWGGWRIGKMRRSIDLMAVTFPFEEQYYKDAGIPVFFSGHPMTERIGPPERPKEVPEGGKDSLILLFPGSRKQEVRMHLPLLFSAVRIIRSRIPSARFVLGAAPLINIDGKAVPEDLRDMIQVREDAVSLLGEASLVIAASGTVTLQTALSGTPAVVIFKSTGFTYSLGRALVKVPWIAMPNLLAGKMLYPELIQEKATGENIAREASSFLADPERYRDVSRNLIKIYDSLHIDNGLKQLAEKSLEMCLTE